MCKVINPQVSDVLDTAYVADSQRGDTYKKTIKYNLKIFRKISVVDRFHYICISVDMTRLSYFYFLLLILIRIGK